MAEDLKPRTTQGRVKHEILANYLKAWAGIITNGLKPFAERARKEGKDFTLHFIYIDCNASNGRFAGELEDVLAGRSTTPIFGSAIIGIKELDAHAEWVKNKYGINVITNAILIEMKDGCFARLKESLEMAQLTHRVKETDNFFSLNPNEIAIVQADSTLLVKKIINYTQAGTKFSLFFLDPYGPKAIPLDVVRQIISKNRHDVIINMPYQDLHKKQGILSKGLLSTAEKSLLKNYDDMFGNADWQKIAKAINFNSIWEIEDQEETSSDQAKPSNQNDSQKLELELMECYRNSLQSTDPNLTVKSIGLRFPDKERTMFYLYLTTHDPDGALQMNEVLRKASFQEHELRWRLKEAKRFNKTGQLSMFDMAPTMPQFFSAPTKEEIGNHIQQLLGRKILTRKDIYRALANESYLASEINSALAYLKKEKMADYNGSPTSKTNITIY